MSITPHLYSRTKDRCSKPNCTEDVLIRSSQPVTSIALNPLVPYHLAAGSGDGCVRVYDRRMLGTRSEKFTLCSTVCGSMNQSNNAAKQFFLS